MVLYFNREMTKIHFVYGITDGNTKTRMYTLIGILLGNYFIKQLTIIMPDIVSLEACKKLNLTCKYKNAM